MENNFNKNRLEDHFYAKTIEGKTIYIEQAISGKNGYFCPDCGREMIAKKGDVKVHHFAHDAKDVKIERKCIYSNEQYRHKLGKEILQRIKQVKVPTLYKYPPIGGVEGQVIKIKDSCTIAAHEVKIELDFYEDENGNIKFGKNVDYNNSNKHLLFRPDVAFFNSKSQPILLIELVATHKVDSEKLAKIKRLGINSIEITLPKDSEQAIEKTFYNTYKTIWLYNYEEENFKYSINSNGINEGIPSFDELQRRVFETAESYNCRSTQINNFIRGFRKVMESEQYTNTQQYLRGEIQRIENNTKDNRERLRTIERQFDEEAEGYFRDEISKLTRKGDSFRERAKQFERDYSNLEERYNRKKGELISEERDFEPECQDEIRRIEDELREPDGSSGTLDERIRDLRKRQEYERETDENHRRRLLQCKDEETRIIEYITDRRKELAIEYKQLEYRTREENERNERTIRGELEERGRRIRDRNDRIRNSTKREFEKSCEDTITAVFERDYRRIQGRIDSGIKGLLEVREAIINIRKEKAYLTRLREAKEVLDEGTYKNWL